MANNFTCSELKNFDAEVAANQAIMLSQTPENALGAWKAISSESWADLTPDSGTGAVVQNLLLPE